MKRKSVPMMTEYNEPLGQFAPLVSCPCGAEIVDDVEALKFHFEHCDDAKRGDKQLLNG
jgi:hypothetical protein